MLTDMKNELYARVRLGLRQINLTPMINTTIILNDSFDTMTGSCLNVGNRVANFCDVESKFRSCFQYLILKFIQGCLIARVQLA